ncbi:MAG TPA: diguanylate cyclase, partial [Vicinamibacteria bacterium]
AGDEFIAVLPKTSYDQARQFSYRIQDTVEATVLDVGVGPLKVGISMGLASYPASAKDLESLLMAADKNMYEDKARRRGRKRGLETPADSFQPSLFEKEELQGQRPG